jgi:Mn-containing catalase
MFLHKSILIHEVRVQNPDPVFAEKLLEQYGGATGELSAALTYLTQSYHIETLAFETCYRTSAQKNLVISKSLPC